MEGLDEAFIKITEGWEKRLLAVGPISCGKESLREQILSALVH
jgi:hypothetical protein